MFNIHNIKTNEFISGRDDGKRGRLAERTRQACRQVAYSAGIALAWGAVGGVGAEQVQ